MKAPEVLYLRHAGGTIAQKRREFKATPRDKSPAQHGLTI